jgi:mitogen-activated protein kinase kinase kinase 7
LTSCFEANEFNAHLVLEPRLQPPQPDETNPQSVEIYENHKKVARNYIRDQLELKLLFERRNELEALTNDSQSTHSFHDEYSQLKRDKEDMLKLRHDLSQQVAKIRRQQRQQEAAADGGWVLVEKC